MIEFTLPDRKIVEKIKQDFIFVDIDIRDSGEVIFDGFRGSKREFAIDISYDFYPSSVFIDENAEVVYGQPGYQDKDKFLNILNFIQSHSYKKMEIDEFK